MPAKKKEVANNSRIKKVIIMIAVAQLAGAIGSIFTFDSIATWYATLAKPSFTPPSWAFGPVWLSLYTLMGIAAGLVWASNSKFKRPALYLFFLQLALNAVWSIIFFGLRLPSYAFAEIVLLWIAIAATIFYFNKVSKNAAALLIPYIIWVTIAASLNYFVWILNGL
jgi:translocator protein